jgi:hypothetical protein
VKEMKYICNIHTIEITASRWNSLETPKYLFKTMHPKFIKELKRIRGEDAVVSCRSYRGDIDIIM